MYVQASVLVCFLPQINAITYFQRCGWAPSHFYTQENDVRLVKSIMSHDNALFDATISSVNVNTRGKKNITFLYCSLFSYNYRAFKILLDKGADPTVLSHSSFGDIETPTGVAIAHLVCSRGDFYPFANLLFNSHKKYASVLSEDNENIASFYGGLEWTPIFFAATINDTRSRKLFFRLLVDKGASLNHKANGMTIVQIANFKVINLHCISDLLDIGYDPFMFSGRFNLMHILVNSRDSIPETDMRLYRKIIDYLERKGDSFIAAKADFDRWKRLTDIDDSVEVSIVKSRIARNLKLRNKSSSP